MENSLPPLQETVLTHTQQLSQRADVAAALEDLKNNAPEAMKLQVALCEIPAPTFHEEVRAAEIVRIMKSYGLEDVVIDEIGNVIGRRPGRGNGPTLAVGAHMDTVFPEGTPIKVRQEGNRYYAPGIGDNCSGLRTMLETLRTLQKNGIETEGDLLFVGTVGEEGNGDIRGSKHIFDTRSDIDGFIAVDNTDVTRILHAALGSHRWRCTIEGKGGHSYLAFGKVPSAIHAMCLAGGRIAHIQPNRESSTTFTIGTIKGGTSVNTIAPSCTVDIDVRSLETADIVAVDEQIRKAFEEAVAEEHAIWGITDPEAFLTVKIEQIGDRPAGHRPHDCPVLQASRAAQKLLGIPLKNYTWSSTDANKPVSMGIPATCLSAGGVQKLTHTVKEYFDDIDTHLGAQMLLLTTLELVGVKGEKPLLNKSAA